MKHTMSLLVHSSIKKASFKFQYLSVFIVRMFLHAALQHIILIYSINPNPSLQAHIPFNISRSNHALPLLQLSKDNQGHHPATTIARYLNR